MPASVASLVADPLHTGPLDGAPLRGEAATEGRIVQVGLWLGAAAAEGRAERARFRASTCAALIASAEAACRLLEGGLPPDQLDEERLRAALSGLHPLHHDRVALVVRAVRAALSRPQKEHR